MYARIDDTAAAGSGLSDPSLLWGALDKMTQEVEASIFVPEEDSPDRTMLKALSEGRVFPAMQ